jgi:competence protein ComEA
MFKKILTFTALLVGLNALAVTLDINSATEAELDSIKGVGPSLSSKILDERQKAPFKNWQDFMHRVKGIRKATAEKFSNDGVTVNGEGFHSMPALVPAKQTP